MWCAVLYLPTVELEDLKALQPKGISRFRWMFLSMEWLRHVMLRPCAEPATLCHVRAPHSPCAVPCWTLRTAVVMLVLVLALVTRNDAPAPSVLTMGVKSLPIAVNAATRPAAGAHHKSFSPQTQSPRATAVVPDQSLGTGPSAVKATATRCWGPWGIPCAAAWPMER